MDLKYKKILNQVIEKLKQRKTTLGIILYGSLSNGQNHTYSDIDLIVISEEDVDKSKCVIIDGNRSSNANSIKQDYLNKREISHIVLVLGCYMTK